MINRELIRIKTVQLLYSYLLVENPFSLESQPSAPTKEKRFAYSLYLDLLFLMTKIAEEVAPNARNPLAETRFIRNVLADDKIRGLSSKYVSGFPFISAVNGLASKVKDSAVYRRFLKSLNSNSGDENIWKEIFDLIVMTDPSVNEEIMRRVNYTLKGVDRMRQIMETTFSNFFASADNVVDALKILRHSMDKTRELYFRILALPIAITRQREREIDNAQYKLLKSADDINPNLRFVDNEFVKFLSADEGVQQGIDSFKIDWLAENEGFVKSMLKMIMQSQIYQDYLDFPATDFKTDCEFWRNVFRYIIFLDDAFLGVMEDGSVFWNDDLDVIGTFILKSIKRLGDGFDPDSMFADKPEFVLPMFKDDEDEEFGAQLFADVIRKKDFYRELILENIDKSQWEVERLAFMDSVILITAIAEILNFPKIPLSVTFNEYIEIAKFYSTPRSGTFINGLLGRIVSSLQDKGILHKTFSSSKF